MLIFIAICAETAKGFSDSWAIGILKALWMLNKNSLIGGGLWTHKNQSISITPNKVQILQNKLQILGHWRLGNYGNKSIYKVAHIRKPVSTVRKKCDSISCHFGLAASEENWDNKVKTSLRVWLHWMLQCLKSWYAMHLVPRYTASSQLYSLSH